MKSGILQSTLREMQGIGRSINLWITFASVVLLFAIVGPFGTLERLPLLQRFGYWLVLHSGAWSIALISAILGNVLLRQVVPWMFWRMLIGSIVAAVPIPLIIRGVQQAWFGSTVPASGLLQELAITLPLCIIFCVISYLAMSSTATPAPAESSKPASSTWTETTAVNAGRPDAADIPLLSRLRPENRGALRRLSVEDHYTMVVTSRGRELILLRFSDAIRETGDSGLQVHRSHWVAFDVVDDLIRDDGKLALRLEDGSLVPVSRTHAAAVRARFG